MSKIKNGALDQYGKVKILNGIGGERVNCTHKIARTISMYAYHCYRRVSDYNCVLYAVLQMNRKYQYSGNCRAISTTILNSQMKSI